jgi:hypothetical protein
MAYTRYQGERVSKPHAAILRSYERKFGTPVQINDGARTIPEQWDRWNTYQRGGPLAAYPNASAPHIKDGADNHALDINSGNAPGQASHVAAYYKSLGVNVAFNVPGEAWHMDTLDVGSLRDAAKKVDSILKVGSFGPAVVRLKKLLYDKGYRNFSGKRSSNRYRPMFNKWTRAAVKRFQREHGLTPDGVVGPATMKKLER